MAQDFELRGAAIGACREGGLGLGVPTRPDSRAEPIFEGREIGEAMDKVCWLLHAPRADPSRFFSPVKRSDS
jgi:hypothetical protein